MTAPANTTAKHLGTPRWPERVPGHSDYTPRHCNCLPCTHHLTAQHIGREGLTR